LLGLAGCLSFPDAVPCDGGTGRCGPANGGSEADGSRGGSGGDAPEGGTVGGAGGTGGGAGGTVGGAGGTGGGAGGTGGAGGQPPPAVGWRFVTAGGAEPYRTTSRGYATSDGGSHTCALTTDDRLFCWGANMDGQLGTGDGTPRIPTPVEIDPGSRWRTVSAGAAHTCGIRANGPVAGGLFCWGEAEHGRLGVGDAGLVATVVPRRVGGESDWTSVSAGGGHTCGLREGGQLYCWGANGYGQLGLDDLETESFRTPQLVGGPGWTQVSAGLAHTCGVENGVVFCWGAAEVGQVGASRAEVCLGQDLCLPDPRRIDGLPEDIRQISTGEAHSCALTGAGEVYCWGASYEGAFASGTDTSADPVLMGVDAPIAHFDAGGANTCVSTADFSVCFGEGRSGQRGNGYPDVSPAAATEASLPALATGRYTQFSVGGEHVCGVTSAGELYCFGSQSDGQLGQGVFSGVTEPMPVALEGRAIKVAVAHEDTACALVAGVDAASPRGDVYCWGDGTEDQLLGRGGARATTPVRLTETGDYVDLVVGERFGCALTATNAVRCWGRGDRGQLGNGRDQGSRGTLVEANTQMTGLGEPYLVAGSFHVCLVGSDMADANPAVTAQCWGFGPEGQLGPEAADAGPHAPLGLHAQGATRAEVAGLALGTTRTFGIDPLGDLVAWGGLRNLFDNADYTGRQRTLAAMYVLNDPDDSPWLRLRAHMDRLCGLRRGGEPGPRLACADVYAADGEAERFDALGLRVYPDLAPWADLAAGDNVTCGLAADGRLFCAGYNHFGQLGDGRRQSTEPEALAEIRGRALRFHQVAVGSGFACGVSRTDGVAATDRGLYCWGRGHRGQTGLGVADVTRPVPVSLPEP
jgi:alpha-tubulin suppressor-like RCC1 family protein